MNGNTLHKVREYIRANRMLVSGETVCVGLSGGADSVCLLILLHELAGALGVRVTAFHVNHSLRGKESDGDEAYVRQLCASLDIPLQCFTYDIRALASESGKGLEETGRNMRRVAAEEAADAFHAEKIALAHHAGDNAETVLFNLVRGTSAGGLKGILPVNGPVIRPLLCLERFEIREELTRRGIVWREDSSNDETEYSRNLLRNAVIPVLSEKINPGTVKHINEAAADCAEAFEMIEEAAAERLRAFSVRSEEGLLLKNDILTGRSVTDGRIVLKALEQVAHSAADLTRTHARELCALFGKQTGRVLKLPYKTRAERVYEGVLIRGGRTKEPGVEKSRAENLRSGKNGAERDGVQEEKMVLPVNGKADFHGLTITTEIINRSEIPYKIPEKRYTKWFDYDKISGCGILRAGRPEDYLVINHAGGRKKLKKFFTDEKVPRAKRNGVLCLAAGSEILWVIGYRMGESAKITEETESVLKIDITGEIQ